MRAAETGLFAIGADSAPVNESGVTPIVGKDSCGIAEFTAAPAAEPETPEAAPVIAEET